MASRRLDISSLLCDDDVPEPVILAPHLRNPSSAPSHTRPALSPSLSPTSSLLRPSSNSRQAIHHPSPPSNIYPLPSQFSPSNKSYIGLDALVHAATEERRRLSGGSTSESDTQQRPSPVDQRHIPQFHHQLPLRQHRPLDDYSTSPIQRHSPVHSPLQTIHSPAHIIRSPAYSPPLHHQPQPHHHIPERHRMSIEEPRIRMSPVDDMHHRPSPIGFFPPHRQLIEHEHRLQQHDFLRQRQHHEQLLLQEQQQQQLTREHQLTLTHAESLPTFPRVPSMPLQIEATSQPRSYHTSNFNGGRKSDPGQLHHVAIPTQADALISPPIQLTHQPPPLIQVSSHPNKKRRYSDSPMHLISSEKQYPFNHDSEMMSAKDLGYGRADIVGVSVTSSRKPGSGNGSRRKHSEVVEVVSSGQEKEIHNISESLSGFRSTHDEGMLVHATDRRSPGGVVTKSEEMERHLHDHALHIISDEKEKKRPWSRPANEIQSPLEPVRPKTKHPPPPTSPLQPLTAKVQEEDAHEWFLEHYDKYPPPNSPCLPSHLSVSQIVPPSGLVPPVPRISKSPVPMKQTPAPTTMPEAAVVLEQELELGTASPIDVTGEVEPNIDTGMDVDIVVTELVADTLEADDVNVESARMDVDVDDELLSLVDDRPLPHMRRRTSGNSSISITPTTKPLPSLRTSGVSDAIRPPSPSPISITSATTATRPSSERGSMPPPNSITFSRSKEREKKEPADSATTPASITKKKKEGSSKPVPKPKTNSISTTAKSRTKPGPAPKLRNIETPTVKSKASASIGKKKTASRSRSASAMPSVSVGPEGSEVRAEKQEEEEEEDDHDDDKLYCVCKTKYDEDRFMIACDRCDEWYHTQCVNMPDLEVDLVDQFICPLCVEKNPHLSLKTTYKPRCLFGLKHPDPSSPKACHKPARGAFSKYCSDECGVKCIQSRVDAWTKKGGKKEKLWETVKNAEKREGVVICANGMKLEVLEACKQEEAKEKLIRPKKAKIEREVERLNGLLDSVVKLREEIKKGMEAVLWREKLLELASERAEQVGQCGWDQRLCFGDEEWADFGAGVLESYEDVRIERMKDQSAEQDTGTAEGEGEWWCPGKKVCDRHAGWQTIRYRDVCNEKEKKDDALLNLTTREREIRKRIEDILDPHGRNCNDSSSKSPLKASNNKLSNGHTKGKTNGDITKKGKKRKAPS